MQINKQVAVRRLLHSGIRMVIFQEDPLATHLIAVSAFDLTRQYAEKKGISLEADLYSQIPPDLVKSAAEHLTRIHNFIGHADRDPDDVIDVSGLVPFTDAYLALTAQMYEELFNENTGHMSLFRTFVALQYPHLMTDEYNRKFSAVPGANGLRNSSRTEQLEILKSVLRRPERLDELEY